MTEGMAIFEPYGPAWNAKHCKQSRHQRLQNAVDEIRALHKWSCEMFGSECEYGAACVFAVCQECDSDVYPCPTVAILERLEGRQ